MTDEQTAAGTGYRRLDPYCSRPTQLVAIVDTNALFSCLAHDVRSGRESRLRRMTTWHTSVLYAPDHVYDEVYEHLADLSGTTGLPVDRLRACFEEDYLPLIRFVEVAADEVAVLADPQIMAITDPDDVPTGVLAKMISPCLVFSVDKHLRRPGFAAPNWLTLAGHAVDVAEGSSRQNAADGLLAAPGYAAVGLVRLAGRKLNVSPFVIVGGLVLVAGLFLADARRRATAARAFERVSVPLLQAYGTLWADAEAQRWAGTAGLREAILPPPAEPTVKQMAAIVLARDLEPLLAREVQERIEWFLPPELVPTVNEVRAVLRDNPEFDGPRRYRFEFGRYLAPSPVKR